jgi:uncharacterized protein (TIGR02231 family)
MRFLSLVLLSVVQLTAQEKVLTTKIEAVTVYLDRAEITRSAETYLAVGEHELKITDLPTALQDQSLRINGGGSAAAKITDIKIELEHLDTIPKDRLTNLKEKLEELQAEERVYTDRLTLLGREKELLDQIKSAVVNQTQNKDVVRPTMDDWTKLFAFYDANAGKINEEIRTLEKKRGDVSQKRVVVQQQIHQLSGYSKPSRKNVTVIVTVTKAGNLTLTPSYVLTGARWYPVYDLRVNPEDQSVELVYYAMVAQKTGEDWKNVQLSISTARPNISATMPALASWYLNVRQYDLYDGDLSGLGAMGGKPSRAAGAGYRSYEKSAKKEDRGEEAEEAIDETSLEMETAVVETRSTSVVFTIPKATSIPADNFDHKVAISTQKLMAELEYSAVPKLSTLAYLKGRIENTTDVPFLSGNVNIFFGNNFVGTSSIGTVIPTEKFDAFLGVDDAIKIKREQVRDYQSEKGLFSKTTKKTFEYKMTIESFRRSTDSITVYDQFPVSSDERIKVTPVLPEFEKDQTIAKHAYGVVERKSNGMVEWRLRVKPKEKVELRIKYIVEYPREINVDGL